MNPAHQPAGAAVRAILRDQLDAMLNNEAGVVAARDPEHLHRYRVALRRTRSCIGQMKDALPEDRIAEFKPELAWLGSITGPKRDADVFLEDMDRYRRKLDEAGLDPLLELIRGEQRREHESLVDALGSERYRSLVAGWRRFVEAPFDIEDAPQAGRPIVEIASERIVARYDRVIRRGRRLDAMKETGKLHRLRIEGKKLRYLLEFFRDLYPVETVQPLIATLKNLQDHLGRFNDLQVQQKALASMTGRLDSSPDTRVAVEALLERLARKERRVRKRFAEEFGRFDTAATARRIEGVSP